MESIIPQETNGGVVSQADVVAAENAQVETPAEDQASNEQPNAELLQSIVKDAAKDAFAELSANQQPAEADSKEVSAEGAPVKYEFDQDLGLDSDLVSNFKRNAREAGLSQEVANKILTGFADTIHKNQATLMSNLRKEWESQTMSDKEIGGDNYKQAIADARAGVQAVGNPAFFQLLLDTNMDVNPEFVRAFAKVGKGVIEDSIVGGSFRKAMNRDNSEMQVAEGLYPEMIATLKARSQKAFSN